MTGIYYADLFEINGKGCLVMGFGKSKTCRSYTGDSTVEITSDYTCFEKCNNDLIGYSGYSLLLKHQIDKQTDHNTVVKFILRMLNNEETKFLKIKDITSVDLDTIVKMCEFNINYDQPSDRSNEFRTLIQDSGISFLLVPWCDSMETKGNKIRNYIK